MTSLKKIKLLLYPVIFINGEISVLLPLHLNFQRCNIALIHLIGLFMCFVTLLEYFQDIFTGLYCLHNEFPLIISGCLAYVTVITYFRRRSSSADFSYSASQIKVICADKDPSRHAYYMATLRIAATVRSGDRHFYFTTFIECRYDKRRLQVLLRIKIS